MAKQFSTPLGDSALVVEAGECAPGMAAYIESLGLAGVVDVVPAFDTVAVHFDPLEFNEADLLAGLAEFVPGAGRIGTEHTVPVCYEMGEDLEEVAGLLGVSPDAVVARHAAGPYDCKAIGFCPGFPYLGWLDEHLSGLGRLGSPRLRVPAGSVAVTGRMTGVYTLERPGGWRIIGRTPLVLVDVADGYYPISVGDSVRFRPIDTAEFERLKGERL